MVLVYLHERRIRFSTQLFGAITSLGKRTTRRKMRDVGRESGDLVQLGSFFVRRIRDALQQTSRVRIRRRIEQLTRPSLLKNFSGIHDNDLVRHSGDDTEVVCD